MLARQEGEGFVAETLEKFPITNAIVSYRVGTLDIPKCAAITLTTSPHLEEPFVANHYLIDSIKARVPIWKQESYATVEVEWTSPCPNCGLVPDVP